MPKVTKNEFYFLAKKNERENDSAEAYIVDSKRGNLS